MEKLLELLKKYKDLYVRLAVDKFYIYTPNGQKIKEIKICDFFNLIFNNYYDVSHEKFNKENVIYFEGEAYPSISCYFTHGLNCGFKKYDAVISYRRILADLSYSWELIIRMNINKKVINYKHIVKYLPEHIKLYFEMNELYF